MGFFDLFKNDPEKELDKAEALLDQDDGIRALRIVKKVSEKNGDNQRAQQLLDRINTSLAVSFLEKAKACEENGALIESAEWIEVALEYVDDADRKARLKEKANELRQADQILDAQPLPIPEQDPVKPAEPEPLVDPETHFLALVGMLHPSHADEYRNRPESFIHAFLAFNEGRPEESRNSLEKLLEDAPDDPVYRFERSRCALMLEDFDTARDDLEAIWSHFGNDPIDEAATLSVPILWADVMLRKNAPLSVVERIAEFAQPERNNPNLSLLFGIALQKSERFEEAVDFFGRAFGRFEGNPSFPLQLGDVLNGLGRWQEAVAVLEKAIAPSCAGGRCGTRPKHLPTFRLLVRIYLDRETKLKRARELITYIAHAQNGRLAPEDYHLLARYHELMDDPEAANEARAQAERLAAEVASQNRNMQADIPKIHTGEQAVL